MKLVQQSPNVFLAEGPVAMIGRREIEALTQAIDASTRRRVRINTHASGGDSLHEMFIALKSDSYIHPHKHPGKSEAFHLVHGAVDVVILDEDGDIVQVVKLAANDQEHAFYYRLSAPFYHTLLIRSDMLVVHEITNGPFDRAGTVFAPFAPDEDDRPAAASYMQALRQRVERFDAGDGRTIPAA